MARPRSRPELGRCDVASLGQDLGGGQEPGTPAARQRQLDRGVLPRAPVRPGDLQCQGFSGFRHARGVAADHVVTLMPMAILAQVLVEFEPKTAGTEGPSTSTPLTVAMT